MKLSGYLVLLGEIGRRIVLTPTSGIGNAICLRSTQQIRTKRFRSPVGNGNRRTFRTRVCRPFGTPHFPPILSRGRSRQRSESNSRANQNQWCQDFDLGRYLPNTDPQQLLTGRQFHEVLKGKDKATRVYELLGFREMDLQLELQASLHLLLKDEDHFSSVFYEKVFGKLHFCASCSNPI